MLPSQFELGHWVRVLFSLLGSFSMPNGSSPFRVLRVLRRLHRLAARTDCTRDLPSGATTRAWPTQEWLPRLLHGLPHARDRMAISSSAD